jgi:hypothetical protein
VKYFSDYHHVTVAINGSSLDLEVMDRNGQVADRMTVTRSLPAAVFKRGDAGGNGAVDLADVIFLLEYLFLRGASPACPDAADLNDTGELEVADAVYCLIWLFSGGLQIPPPGPAICGPDPSADILPPCNHLLPQCR